MPVICTGCDNTFDGVSLNNTAGVFSQTLSYTAQGVGQGVLSTITGFPLGTVQIYTLNSTDGACVPITGTVTPTGSGIALTGFTGCTGATPCTSNLYIDFSGNPNIWRLVPTAQGNIQVTNYGVGTITGVGAVNQTSQNTSTVIFDQNAQVNCGFGRYYQIDVRFFVPGFSGSLLSSTSHTYFCQPCITG
jgi:hypothetical protein